MNTEIELPDDVIAEIKANRKIAAIKLLRARRGIGLKEAKKIVDTYADNYTSGLPREAAKSVDGVGCILNIILGAGIIYGIYRYFT